MYVGRFRSPLFIGSDFKDKIGHTNLRTNLRKQKEKPCSTHRIVNSNTKSYECALCVSCANNQWFQIENDFSRISFAPITMEIHSNPKAFLNNWFLQKCAAFNVSNLHVPTRKTCSLATTAEAASGHLWRHKTCSNLLFLPTFSVLENGLFTAVLLGTSAYSLWWPCPRGSDRVLWAKLKRCGTLGPGGSRILHGDRLRLILDPRAGCPIKPATHSTIFFILKMPVVFMHAILDTGQRPLILPWYHCPI